MTTWQRVGGRLTNMAQPVVIKKKSLSKWATEGLDINDTTFSKLHSKESNYEDKKELYDLQPESFTTYRNNLIEKMDRIHGRQTYTVNDGTDDHVVFSEYSMITEAQMDAARDTRWPANDPIFATQSDADKFTDEQIKANVIGNYIFSSLTTNAKDLLKGSEDFFNVKETGKEENYIDGPALFWKLAEIVDPDNEHLIENVRTEMRGLNVKDFGFSIIKLLSHFQLLMKRVSELGGTYSKDEQFLDFWTMLKTMKEEEFTRYVKMEKDKYNATPKSQRGKLDAYIRDMKRKEVQMKSDDEWNVMSTKDAMVMALVNLIDTENKKKDKSSNKNSKKNTDNNEKDKKDTEKEQLTDDEKRKRKDERIPSWKKEAPTESESKTKEVDDRTYHYCGKCRGGKGMWALHKEDEHKSGFKPPSKSDKSTKDDKKDSDKEDKEDKDTASVKVKSDLLKNAKSYLAQFEEQDFQ